MTPLLGTIAGFALEAFGAWQGRRADVARAKHAERLAVIRARTDLVADAQDHRQAWELEALRRGQWAAAWFTVLFSVPAVLCFLGPWGANVTLDGFAALQEVPDWYKAGLGAAVAAAFGIREVASVFTRRRVQGLPWRRDDG